MDEREITVYKNGDLSIMWCEVAAAVMAYNMKKKKEKKNQGCNRSLVP